MADALKGGKLSPLIGISFLLLKLSCCYFVDNGPLPWASYGIQHRKQGQELTDLPVITRSKGQLI